MPRVYVATRIVYALGGSDTNNCTSRARSGLPLDATTLMDVSVRTRYAFAMPPTMSTLPSSPPSAARTSSRSVLFRAV